MTLYFVGCVNSVVGDLRANRELLAVAGRPSTRRFAADVKLGVADAGLDFASLTKAELRAIRSAAADSAREAARQAAEQVIEDRRKAEVAKLQNRPKELGE